MARRSEAPTVPPPFNVDRFAKDSDAKVVAARAAKGGRPEGAEQAQPTERPEADVRSERRLITRPKMEAVSTDEAWARSMTGSLTATPLEQLKGMPLDHRAAYMMSWMDGTIDLDTLIEVVTMPRDEVLRIVRDLYESGLIEVG